MIITGTKPSLKWFLSLVIPDLTASGSKNLGIGSALELEFFELAALRLFVGALV